MAKRGRPAGVPMTEMHRDKIRNSKILQCLIDHAEGKEGMEMSPARVTAALGLLDRVMPKLAQQTIDGELNHKGSVTQRIERIIVRPPDRNG